MKNSIKTLFALLLAFSCTQDNLAPKKVEPKVVVYENQIPDAKKNTNGAAGRFYAGAIPSIAISKGYSFSLLSTGIYNEGNPIFTNGDAPPQLKMASTNAYLYTVSQNIYFPNSNPLNKWDYDGYRLTSTDLTPGISWTGTDGMTAIGGNLYIVQGGTLWKVNATTGARSPFSAYPTGWEGTEAMAAWGNFIYAIQGGTLWRVDVTNGSVTSFSQYPTGWQGTEAMSATNGNLFAVQGGEFWRVNLSNGAVASLGNGWSGTKGMAAVNGFIYAVQGDVMWKVNGSNGSTVQVGSLTHPNTNSMTMVVDF